MHCKSYSHFFSKKFKHIWVSLDVNFNESLTNDIVSFEQLGPRVFSDNFGIIKSAKRRGEILFSLRFFFFVFFFFLGNMIDIYGCEVLQEGFKFKMADSKGPLGGMPKSAQILSGQVTTERIVLKFGDMMDMDMKFVRGIQRSHRFT